MRVLDYKKIDVNKLIYQEPIKKSNFLYSNIYYNLNTEEIPLFIQTPKLKLDSDLNINSSKCFIELELDKEHLNFFKFINSIDDNNIDTTYMNSEEWFNNKLPMDVIDDFYVGQIKMKNYNKSPIIKFRVPIYKNKKGCEFFGKNLQIIDPQTLKKNTEVICIIALNGIKFYKQRFECDWTVLQLRAYLNETINISKCLVNDDYLSDNETDTQLYDINNLQNSNSNTKKITILDNQEANNLENQEANNLENQETNNLENQETTNLENQETNNLENQETNNLENQETTNLENQETTNLENQETYEEDSTDELEEFICDGLEEQLEEIEIKEENLYNEKNIDELINEIKDLKKLNQEKNIEISKIKNEYQNLN